MSTTSFRAVPTFRISDVDIAKRFYVDYLGFGIDWEHYYEPGAPVYMQISRNGMLLHLTQNQRFKEALIVFVETFGLESLRDELADKNPATPKLTQTPWNTKQLEVLDPFDNLLRFNEIIE